MKPSLLSVAVIATFAVAVSFRGVQQPAPERVAAPKEVGARMLGRLPVAFVPNLGQWEHAAQYVARVGAMTVFLEQQGWSFTLVEQTAAKRSERRDRAISVDGANEKPARGVAVRMAFAHAMQPELIAEQRLPGVHHYFLGNDPAKWRSDVPLYGAVRYRELYSGVDVRTREHDGHFEYDVLLQPGADLEPVEIVVEGIDRMHIDRDGALVMETLLGPVLMPVPLSWEEAASGEKQPIACQCELRSANRFGFKVTGRRPGWTLVVDPGLVYSTFLGGAGQEEATALALDAQGSATVAGWTSSTNFPTTPGAFVTSYNNWDAFVTRLSPTGSSLVYSTFLAGTSGAGASALAVDAQGAATVAGSTISGDFPTTPGAFDTTHNGGWSDVFVTRLSPTGSTLVYSTFLGGADGDRASAIALDALGATTVAGVTTSTNFPTTPGAFDTSHNGGTNGDDAFVTRLSPTGSALVYSTFLGGAGDDNARAIALGAQGAVTVAGWTWSTDFPTTPGAFDTSFNAGFAGDAFVTRLSPTGSSLVYSTFLGGSFHDAASAIALDAQGAATVAGLTDSTDFPTTPGAFDASFDGGDAFVTRLSPTGSTLVYSTFLGGSGHEVQTLALALDAQGAAIVAGSTQSPDFPTTPGAFDVSFNAGLPNAYVSRFSPSGSSLVYSTFLGGTYGQFAYALALDAQGTATVAGMTASADFPTTPGAFDTTLNNWDGFVTRLDMLPTGVAAFGSSSPGCNGPLPMSVNSMPRLGNLSFVLTCGNAAPNSVGVIGFSGGALPTPFAVLGISVWIDPTAFWTATAFSNPIGACEAPFPIPPTPTLAGLRFFSQFVWFGPAAPPPCPPLGLSATNALDITIQP